MRLRAPPAPDCPAYSGTGQSCIHRQHGENFAILPGPLSLLLHKVCCSLRPCGPQPLFAGSYTTRTNFNPGTVDGALVYLAAAYPNRLSALLAAAAISGTAVFGTAVFGPAVPGTAVFGSASGPAAGMLEGPVYRSGPESGPPGIPIHMLSLNP